MSDTNATLATRVRHEWDKNDIVRYECYTNDTSPTRVEKFDFYNDTGKNIFTPLYLLYGKWKTTRRGTNSF